MTAEAVGNLSAVSAVLGDGSLSPDGGLLALASHHRLELLLFDSLLRDDRLSTRTRAIAVAALECAASDNMRLFDELQSVIGILTGAGIPSLPLKGPTLALLLWNDLRLRRCRDIDILVDHASVPKAVRLLEQAGYSSPPPTGGLLRELELIRHDKGVALDLHWNITHGEMAFPLDFNALWAERDSITYNGVTLPMMSPEWLFIVMAIYLAKSYPWPELVYLSDLARLILRFPQMDWERVHDIATQTGTRRICAVGLALIDDLAGSSVPARAVARFPTSAKVRTLAQRINRAADRHPMPDHFRNDSSGASRRLRRILSHTTFRERPADKVWSYLSLVQLLLMPARTRAGQGWAQASFDRLAHLAGSAAAPLSEDQWLASRTLFGRAIAAPGVHFFALDNAGILLSEERQELFALSPSAAFLWCSLHEGIPRRRIERQLSAQAGRSLAQTRAEVAVTLGEWRVTGLLGYASGRAATLAVAPPCTVRNARLPAAPAAPADSRPHQQRRYQLINTVVEVALPCRKLTKALDSALSHLAVSEVPAFKLSVTRETGEFLIIAEDRVIDRCSDAAAVIPTVKAALCAEAINREDFGLYLHAAMLRNAGTAMLLPAPPQSGKTCLAAALARAGLTYCSDETTLLDSRDFRAQGLRTALTVKTGAWQLLQPLYPELRSLPAHRRCDGKIVKYLRPPPSMRDADAECHVSSIVFPRYVADGTARLTTIPKIEALRRLMDECVAMRLSLAPAEVQGLVDWLSTVDCYALTYSDLPSAVGLLLDLLSPTTHQPATQCWIKKVA